MSIARRAVSAFWVSGVLVLLAALLAALALGSSPAESAFPGANGKIAFRTLRDGNREVYVMDADGSNPTNLTNSGADDFQPAWSADGAKIAFGTVRDGNGEVYVMDADGSAPTRLTNHAANDIEPAWSPDGAKIAFTTTRDGPNPEVYVMDADGSNPTNLTNNPAFDSEPDWQPLSCAESSRAPIAPRHFTPAFQHCRQNR